MRKAFFTPTTEQEHKLVKRVCDVSGQSITGFIRRAIRKELERIKKIDPDVEKVIKELK